MLRSLHTALHPRTQLAFATADPWLDPKRSGLVNLLRLPRRVYKQLFHYSRPDTAHKIMRAPEWAHIKSEWRYVHRLVCRRRHRGLPKQ